jgi:hypothetical protein
MKRLTLSILGMTAALATITNQTAANPDPPLRAESGIGASLAHGPST